MAMSNRGRPATPFLSGGSVELQWRTQPQGAGLDLYRMSHLPSATGGNGEQDGKGSSLEASQQSLASDAGQ